MKGFPIAQKFEEVYIKMRLHDNIDYFQKMRQKEKETAAQIKISAHYRGYRVRKMFRKPKKKKEEPKIVKEKVYKSRIGPYIDGKSSKVGKYKETYVVRGSAGKRTSQEGSIRPKNTPTSHKIGTT